MTQDGKLVNIDGTGNRVAALIFGPNRAIVVVGVNRIVRDVDQALDRIRNYSAGMAGRRHVEKHGFRLTLPCVLDGTCVHCHAENRNCRITTIIDGWSPIVHCSSQHRTAIIIVAEALGF